MRQLERARQFYRIYPIASTVRTQLNWSQYKTGKLTHQDLGQLQMYVNYFDRTEKLPDENPTIGILLCTSKNNTVVKMALPEINQTILASEYKLYLPTTEQLVKEIDEVKQLAEKTKN